MSNSLLTNPIFIDTFSSVVSLYSTLGYRPFNIYSIEWQEPVTVGDLAVVTIDGTVPIFDETCITANQSIIKYFGCNPFDDVRIAINGVASGKIVVCLCV